MKQNVKRKRRHWLGFLLFLLVLVAFWWFETFTLTVSEVTVKHEKIKNDITIVQLTDLHGASFGINNSTLIKKIDNESPDLIAITGDMYTHSDRSGRETATRLITDLSKKYPVYLVNGEHDNNDEFLSDLKERNVHVLDYRKEKITVGNTDLTLYGINNLYYSPTFDLANEFTLDPNQYNILLAHIDNLEAFSRFGIDLSLCGDTHGGQVRLPFVGALNNQGIWFPERGVNTGSITRTKGLYTKGDSTLFVSSGMGNYPVPIRFMNRPEIAVIHLQPEI